MGDGFISPTALAIVTAIVATLSGAVSLLYRQLAKAWQERAERAERQVDVLVPALTEIAQTGKQLLAMLEAPPAGGKGRRP